MSVEVSAKWRTLFAPFDDTQGEFLKFIAAAQTSIVLQVYGFHLPPLKELLKAKQKAGLLVSVILDLTQSKGTAERGDVQELIDGGVPTLIGTSPVHHAILHSKYAVVDHVRVTHGSWNYSLSASQQSNDLHFVEDADYARAYEQHHDRIRSFILMHEMAYQPTGEVAAPAALAADETKVAA